MNNQYQPTAVKIQEQNATQNNNNKLKAGHPGVSWFLQVFLSSLPASGSLSLPLSFTRVTRAWLDVVWSL